MYATLGLLQAVGVGVAAIVVVIVAIFVVSVLISAIKIVKEYERGVIFRLGRVQGGPKGPGLFILLPLVDRMVKIDLRTVTMDVPPQDVITRDNVPAQVALLSLGTSPGVLCKRRGEPLLRRGTLPGQTSDKQTEWPGCVLDLSKPTFDVD